MVFVNAAAGLMGAWQWWRRTPTARFWRVLRIGQAMTALAAIDGLLVLATGEKLPPLHLVYGLTPLGVSFLAEQLRLTSADSVLQAHELEDAQAMRTLPDAEQRAIVAEILRREVGVMAASALIVTVLGLRAGGWL
jgi:hypothetical protein